MGKPNRSIRSCAKALLVSNLVCVILANLLTMYPHYLEASYIPSQCVLRVHFEVARSNPVTGQRDITHWSAVLAPSTGKMLVYRGSHRNAGHQNSHPRRRRGGEVYRCA